MKGKALKKTVAKFLAMALVLGGVAFQPAVAVHAANETSENKENHWETYDGKSFWYENGVKQGTETDEKALVADGTVRGREICDPGILDEKGNGTWFWLDADPKYDGAKACSKEVWMPYIYQNEKDFDDEEIKRNAAESGDMADQVERAIRAAKDGVTDSSVIGKWVRYDKDGKMVKGWYTVEGNDEKLYPTQAGNTYYYDFKTGLMAKGKVEIDGKEYRFDETTGALVEGKAPTDEVAGGNTDNANTNGTNNDTENNASGQTGSDTAEGTDAEKKTKTVCVRETDYDADGKVSSWYEYEYDDAGNITTDTRYTGGGSVDHRLELEYDGTGNETKYTFYDADGNVFERYEYEYDSTGKRTKGSSYQPDYGVFYCEYGYDGAGNTMKETWYNPDGSLSSWYEYEYDGAGNETKFTHCNADGSVGYWYEWEYDSAGNQTKYTRCGGDGRVWGRYEYEYDGAGNLTKETSYDTYGSVYDWTEYEYDDAGNQTKRTYYNSDGSVGGLYEYEYDGAGNLTKETCYDVDGSVSNWTEYEYKTITIQ